MKIIVEENLLQALVNYLQTCPYGQVVGIIQGLGQCEQYKEPKKKGKEE